MSGAPERRALLIAGDVAAFVAFGLFGLATHRGATAFRPARPEALEG
jgi:hypothetical protein